MPTPKLRAIGWNPFFEAQLTPTDLHATVIARVSAHHGSQVEVYAEDGEFRVPVQSAEARGKVAIGDWLVLNAADHRALRLLDRKTDGEEVKQQILVANVDTLIIVSSCNEDFNLSRIERYLALALHAGATPVVVLTKADLCEDHAALDTGALDQRRYASFQKLQAEQTRNPIALARRRERERQLGKSYKSAAAKKRRDRGGR